jgi:arsenite methyltransferase
VGARGFVIGVDMTAEMVARARANVFKSGVDNVEFRLGEIERLPVADASVDVIMSNCVINLSTDKPAVFREAFRVLVPGGRVAIADIVAMGEMPIEIRDDLQAYAGCVAGAALLSEVARMLGDAGFEDVIVDVSARNDEDLVASALIRAKKPLANKN